ncbi:Scramblase-domain-containing protein [Entophlyctis helioformis]|nr:Scramblase-domain-containing protein [Entophlyctis helioformis]
MSRQLAFAGTTSLLARAAARPGAWTAPAVTVSASAAATAAALRSTNPNGPAHVGPWTAHTVQCRSFRPPSRSRPLRRVSAAGDASAAPLPEQEVQLQAPAAHQPIDPTMTATNTVPLMPSASTIVQSPLPEVVSVPVRVRPSASADTLQDDDAARSVLAHPALVVMRQIEMLNVFIGYEQANKYAIKNPAGEDVGFIAEDDTTFTGSMIRQFMGTRRAFKAVVLDRSGNVVLKINRPIKWLLNSTMTIHDAHDNLIGETKQVWNLIRRKYQVFIKRKQFAEIDGEFWTWDFGLRGEQGELLGSVNRNFVGFAREIFTDTGQYAVHMDSVGHESRELSLDERAVMLATAITIDIDYFSRHSNSHGGIMPIPMVMGGGGGSGVPAPAPDALPMPSSGIGGGGVPLPIFVPGVGMGGGSGASGQDAGGVSPGPTGMPGSAADGGLPSGSDAGFGPDASTGAGGASGQDAGVNQWGESPFLSDSEAGVTSNDDTSSWGEMFSWVKDQIDDM